MKILLLDIETSPNTAHVWGLWNQNISTTQLLDSSYTMCFAAKWYGQEGVVFESVQNGYPHYMLARVHRLIDEADAVVHYNGTKFDMPTLNKEFLLHGMPPPSPYKQIDLLKVARNQFKFPSNKLDYVAKALGLKGKAGHAGHETWIKCMGGDPGAWQTMQEYNMQDVVLLEQVYDKMKPWIKNHANHGLYQDNSLVCPNCGSEKWQKRGYAYTASYKYQRYQCTGCGNWFKGGKNLGPKPEDKFVNIS